MLLTPKDMLTRDETWISRPDLLNNFEQLAAAVPDDQLRAQLNNYLRSQLSNDPRMSTKEREQEKDRAVARAIQEYPEIIEYYILEKENTGDQARAVSSEKVEDTQERFVHEVRDFVTAFLVGTDFYRHLPTTLEETRERIRFLKHVIENQGGHRIFYHDGVAVQRESDLQLIFKFVWFASPSAVDAEVNNGRGPVDFSISRGGADKTLVEFKLASNSKLRHGLTNQVPIYEKAGDATGSFKVIIYFSEVELQRVLSILRELELEDDPNIVLIDASDNKSSASKA